MQTGVKGLSNPFVVASFFVVATCGVNAVAR